MTQMALLARGGPSSMAAAPVTLTGLALVASSGGLAPPGGGSWNLSKGVGSHVTAARTKEEGRHLSHRSPSTSPKPVPSIGDPTPTKAWGNLVREV